MNKNHYPLHTQSRFCLAASVLVACLLGGVGSSFASSPDVNANLSVQQQQRQVTVRVVDATGEPVVGASVLVKGTRTGGVTGLDGKAVVNAGQGQTVVVSYVGFVTREARVGAGQKLDVVLREDQQTTDEIVVTALGIKRERKALGYAMDDIKADELMKNKSNNVLNSLAGKIAGVNITQGGGAAGGGSEIVLRGGTSLERDNQPLFVVDGVIYDNSTTVPGNSAFDGTTSGASTNANRLMDINPEDIENMSVLKGPAAAALYGSRASAGAIIITTKKGQKGTVTINASSKLTATSAWKLPKVQTRYKRGYASDVLDADGNYLRTDYSDKAYSSWGETATGSEQTYDNIGDFFRTGLTTDNNVSISSGGENNNMFLSASYYNQGGIIRTTGYEKFTFRFNGEQKWKMLTFGISAAYTKSTTDKTLTSAALYGSSGNGTMSPTYTWSAFDDMRHYMNDDGTRYRLEGVADDLEPWDEKDNPYWVLYKNPLRDKNQRLTGNFSLKADITPWWWVSYRVGLDTYLTNNTKKVSRGGVVMSDWQNGMYSENDYRYSFLQHNIMSNFSHSIGDFNGNLLVGYTSEDTQGKSDYRKAWNLMVPDFYSFDNSESNDRDFSSKRTRHRLQGLYGEARIDWRSTAFFTYSARNDWSSTLPKENRSYFYQSFSGSVLFTEFIKKNPYLTFGKLRASWARVGKDASPYVTNTYLWPVGTFVGGKVGMGNSWQAGNANLKPEITESTELGLEMAFLKNRLRVDFAYYTNNSYNQIMTPRVSNATGYILRDVNGGDVYNKGWELTLSGQPVVTKDFQWESSLNLSHNNGTVKNLLQGIDVLYVTDVQVGGVKAASFNGGKFMGIAGSQWNRTDDGKVILDKNGMPDWDGKSTYCVGDREADVRGGWNNTFTYKNLSLSMLWDFSFGGDVFNGTKYGMLTAGTSEQSANRESITINGVQKQDDGTYRDASYTFERGKVYDFNGQPTSGDIIIAGYYQTYIGRESRNFITKTNYLRLRSLNLTWSLPQQWLAKTGAIKACALSVAANNLLLFTNYDGDPDVSYAGSGSVGSSSSGIDYFCVPSTRSFTFGVNLTF